MNYRVARDGQIFGPYTEAEVHRYLRSGNIGLTDLVQPEGGADWFPVAEVFSPSAIPGGASAIPAGASAIPGGASTISGGASPARLFPDPPDLPWWVALLLGIVTGGIFFVVWDIVQAAWLRRVQPASNALALYIAVGVLYLLRLPSNWREINYDIFGGPPLGPHHGFTLFLVWLGLFLASRAVIRADLLRHFNFVEPLGLRLNSFLTYLFGGLYLQFHFNRLNELKRALHTSVSAV